MFPNPGLNFSRIDLTQQPVRPILTAEASRFGYNASLAALNLFPTTSGQQAVLPLIVPQSAPTNLCGLRPLLHNPIGQVTAAALQGMRYHAPPNVPGRPRPLFSESDKHHWMSQAVKPVGNSGIRVPSLRDVSRFAPKQALHAWEGEFRVANIHTPISNLGASPVESVNPSNERMNHARNGEKVTERNDVGRLRGKRKHIQSSSGESDSDQSREDVPRWQKLTEEDFVDSVLSDTDDEVDLTEETVAVSGFYSQSASAAKFYFTNSVGDCCATDGLKKLHSRFRAEILEKIAKQKENQPRLDPPEMPAFHDHCKCGHHSDTETESESDNSEDESGDSDERSDSASADEQHTEDKDNVDYVKMSESKKHSTLANREINRKRNHPAALHSDLCFNEIGQMNDGPECRCSWAAKKSGVRHNKYAGENVIEKCEPGSSNAHRLYHYILYVEPNPNTTARRSTKISYQDKIYELEGFSVFFHKPLPSNFPQTPLSKWTSEYSTRFMEENMPENFTVEGLELFHRYLFTDIMEMYDLKRYPLDDTNGCPYYHCMPRFVYSLPGNEKEILPVSVVLNYLIENFRPFLTPTEAVVLKEDAEAFREFAENMRGSLVMNANKRPSTIRIDLIDRPDFLPNNPDTLYPLITHFGVRPSTHTYNSNAEYQKILKEYLRMRRIVAMKTRISAEERSKLAQRSSRLKALRNDSQLKRDFVMSISSAEFYRTGLFSDIVQHGLLLTLACAHARFHWSLQMYEKERIHYVFKNRSLLELALTHPSYRTNYGTNCDHARNTLSNCGVRSSKQRAQDRIIQQQLSAKKRGFHTLMEIMSKLGSKKAEQSPLNHNERLEFLGDAVIEFITTIHLFYMFSELDEGGLATYRSAMVQNKNLALLAKKIGLQEFMLYAHGPDLCHESDLRHAMANAFEAMMAAIYLDAGIDECDRIFGHAMFGSSEELLTAWFDLEEHPLKRDNPNGDRHLIKDVPALQLLTELEKSIGVMFKHIRLLAKAFTRRNVGFNNLTLGHNQRLEFLGDTILQLIATDYLYKHFPYHHEGHLSILRTCLVSNKTQSVICDDIGMTKYLVTPKIMQKSVMPLMRVKDKADLVEAFLGALYVDRGFDYCKVFCRICFFPRLKLFIISQRWNDPKSQLQQRCLTLRQMDGGEPDIPEYRTIAVEGPSNTRVYKVAVYFRKKRLAVGYGHTMQLAQMRAAENALIKRADLFPTLKSTTKQTAGHNRYGSGWILKKKYRPSSCIKRHSLLDSVFFPRLDAAGPSSFVGDNRTPKSQIKSLLDLKFDTEGRLV